MYAVGLDVLVARAQFEQGHLKGAAELLLACKRQIIDLDVSAQAAAWSLRALLYSAAGQHASARQAVGRAIDIAETIDDPRGLGDVWNDKARIFLSAGDRRGATEAARKAVSHYRAKGASVLAERARKLVA
jgi:tetratricopeptide (TPR) repeat protein